METLIADRAELVRLSDNGGAFPGSKAWRRAQPFFAALVEFDGAHPEVHAEILRRHNDAVAARTIPAGGI